MLKKKSGLQKLTNTRIKLRANKTERLEDGGWYKAKIKGFSEGIGPFGPFWVANTIILNGETADGQPAKGQKRGVFLNKPEQVDGVFQIGENTILSRFLSACGENMEEYFENKQELDIDLSKYVGMLIEIFNEEKENKAGEKVDRITKIRAPKKKVAAEENDDNSDDEDEDEAPKKKKKKPADDDEETEDDEDESEEESEDEEDDDE